MQVIRRKQPPGTFISQKRFTIVELMVVFGIIIFMAGVTVPLVAKTTVGGETGATVAGTETVRVSMKPRRRDGA